MSVPTEAKILLCVRCPALKRDVILKKKVWEHKITVDHRNVKNKLDLVEQVIRDCVSSEQIYQKIKNPRRLSTQKEMKDFLPYNKYLRVAMKLKDDGTAEVISVYPVRSYPKEGVKKYEPGK